MFVGTIITAAISVVLLVTLPGPFPGRLFGSVVAFFVGIALWSLFLRYFGNP